VGEGKKIWNRRTKRHIKTKVLGYLPIPIHERKVALGSCFLPNKSGIPSKISKIPRKGGFVPLRFPLYWYANHGCCWQVTQRDCRLWLPTKPPKKRVKGRCWATRIPMEHFVKDGFHWTRGNKKVYWSSILVALLPTKGHHRLEEVWCKLWLQTQLHHNRYQQVLWFLC